MFPLIFAEFERLINYYKRKIDDEDSFQELSIFLVELLYSIDIERFKDSEDIKRYIAVCIRNRYITISKEKIFQQNHSTFLNETFPAPYTDPFLEHILKDALSKLTLRQREVIFYSYIYNYTDIEISRYLNISPQAVGRLKNRALKVLKMYFSGGF